MNGWTRIVMGIFVIVMAAGTASAGHHEQAPKGMHHGHGGGMHEEMRARMQAHDARLDELVAIMNDAEGDAKIEAVAAVVNELVEQRRTRRAHMEERWKQHHRGRAERDDEDEEDEEEDEE